MTLPAGCWLEPAAAVPTACGLVLATAIGIRLWTGPQDWAHVVVEGDGRPSLSKAGAASFLVAALWGFYFLALVGVISLETMLGLACIAGVGQATRIASKWVTTRAGAASRRPAAGSDPEPTPPAAGPPAGDG